MPKGVYLRRKGSEKVRQAALAACKKAALANTGSKRSDETRRKLSENKRRFYLNPEKRIENGIRQRGNKAPNWQGGKSRESERLRKSIEFKLWREAVFARDNWTCQDCGVRGANLHPHHIKAFSQFPELRFAIDNGVTLCAICHRARHRNKF